MASMICPHAEPICRRFMASLAENDQEEIEEMLHITGAIVEEVTQPGVSCLLVCRTCWDHPETIKLILVEDKVVAPAFTQPKPSMVQ